MGGNDAKRDKRLLFVFFLFVGGFVRFGFFFCILCAGQIT